MKIEPFPGEIQKQLVKSRRGAGWKIVLTDEQRDWLCNWFPEEENRRLMAASGLRFSTLHRFARELGLAKSAVGMRRIKKRQAAAIKRACEKNGYYDSLRGKPMSEACKRGTARMWQEIREGKREHPAHIMRRNNPRKYRQWMQHRSEERKETYRKEKLRVRWGLEPRTRLRILPDGYTEKRKKMTQHRYLFRRKNYIVEHGSNNIYYDEETNRSDVMEARAHLYGFKIMPLN